LTEARALREQLNRVGRDFGAHVNLKKDHLKRIRLQLQASLDDDGRSGTAGEEREKLVRLDRARAAIGRLAHFCREEIFGRRNNLFSSFIDKSGLSDLTYFRGNPIFSIDFPIFVPIFWIIF
jgi:hypothetical protein